MVRLEAIVKRVPEFRGDKVTNAEDFEIPIEITDVDARYEYILDKLFGVTFPNILPIFNKDRLVIDILAERIEKIKDDLHWVYLPADRIQLMNQNGTELKAVYHRNYDSKYGW
jgi:hypothetical protein